MKQFVAPKSERGLTVRHRSTYHATLYQQAEAGLPSSQIIKQHAAAIARSPQVIAQCKLIDGIHRSNRLTGQHQQMAVFPGHPVQCVVDKEGSERGKLECDHKTPAINGAIAQMFRDYYAWGSANTTPHLHVYTSGMHLKTAGGHRYNIVQNGNKHSQADEALEQVQGKGNKKLRQTIKRTARDVFGVDLY